ncbi:MAG: hypothetical protein ACRDV9_05895 [Acidimicrobiia bacterium]
MSRRPGAGLVAGQESEGSLSGAGQLWIWRERKPLRSSSVEETAAVLVDLDGVLADARGRQRFLQDPMPDWYGFFASCGEDPVIGEIKVLLDLMDSALRVVLLTARPSTIVAETQDWIALHEIRWDLLVMRVGRAYDSTRGYKEAAVAELRRHGFQLLLALEDDRRNVEMFRSRGVPTIYIHSGYYD